MKKDTSKYYNETWVGKKFNWLTVIEPLKLQDQKYKTKWMWKCKCDCGNVKTMSPTKVITGRLKSCGCKRGYYGLPTHRETKTKLHEIWANMKNRCGETKSHDKNYYGRGIKVCDEWMKYDNFSKWAKENGYKEGLSLERIDNDGNYCPENCTWIERSKQQRNKQKTHWVEFQGKRMPLVEACEISGVKYNTAYERLNRGWTVDETFTIPVNKIIYRRNFLR